MLYITTNNQKDAHTAYKTLVSDCAEDGGLYIPFRFHRYDDADIKKMCQMSFSEVLAQILNYFFSAQLTAWDVDFAIGRNPVKLATVGRKIIVSELWHNHGASYTCLENNLFRFLSKNSGIAAHPTDWARTAIRVAVLFGLYSQMCQNNMVSGHEGFDLVMDAGNYFEPIAAYYAKQMGLPFGKIIVCCNADNAAIWDLVHRSEVATATLPANMNLGIKRLLCAAFGRGEMERFAEVSNTKRTYTVSETLLEQRLSDDLFVVVVGADRLPAVVNSVLKTDNYHIDEKTAMSFGAVQDYRAKIGESKLTLIFSENKALSE